MVPSDERQGCESLYWCYLEEQGLEASRWCVAGPCEFGQVLRLGPDTERSRERKRWEIRREALGSVAFMGAAAAVASKLLSVQRPWRSSRSPSCSDPHMMDDARKSQRASIATEMAKVFFGKLNSQCCRTQEYGSFGLDHFW